MDSSEEGKQIKKFANELIAELENWKRDVYACKEGKQRKDIEEICCRSLAWLELLPHIASKQEVSPNAILPMHFFLTLFQIFIQLDSPLCHGRNIINPRKSNELISCVKFWM